MSDHLALKDKRQLCAVVGAQWGDEGKGKLVDAVADQYDLCVRYNGGSNAGHTVVVKGKKYDFHLIPCGITSETGICVLGNGVVVHIPTLLKEIEVLKKNNFPHKGRLFMCERAHLVFDFHQECDGIREGSLGDDKLGTTKKGIGPAYSSKMTRNGLRVGDLRDWDWFANRFVQLARSHESAYGIKVDVEAELARYREYAAVVDEMIVDGVDLINRSIQEGKSVLFEGANAVLLDIDYGTYPYVTSSSPGANGIPSGAGVRPALLAQAEVIGIVKAYTTRVGEGPFPTELENEVGERMRAIGQEFGVTTGRPRRCGWMDTALVRYTHVISGYTCINLTKLDVLSGFEELRICTGYRHKGRVLTSVPASLKTLGEVEVDYITLPGWKEDLTSVTRFEDLPENARNYVDKIEELIGVPIRWVGVGPDRANMLVTGR